MKWTFRDLLLFVFACAGFAASASADWHVQDAHVRRELKVEGEGSEQVCATTTVFRDDHFRSFSLVDAQGQQRPFHLLNAAGSRTSIYFDAVPGEGLYLYPAETRDLPPPGGPPPRSGLKHEARTYDGSEITSASQFNDLWTKAPSQGAAFTAQVYTAHNPFGVNANALHRFEGTLRIKQPGTYTFCTASTDASFLFIDGREVVAWPGKHDVKEGLDGSKRDTVALTAGSHRFTYLHANSGNSSFAIAAMVPPGGKQHSVINPGMFTPAAYAYVGPLVNRDGEKQADFIWENSYMVTIRNHVLHKLVFESPTIGSAQNTTYEWQFGDGTRATGRKVAHLVFKRGDFPVKLTVNNNGVKTSCEQTVRVDPRYGQSEGDDKRAVDLLRQAVQQERNRGIQPEGYALISRGWFFFLREKAAAAFAPRLLAAAQRIPDEQLNEVMLELALGLQHVDEQYGLAEQCFRVILDRDKNPEARALAALHCAGMLNLCQNRPEDARKMLESITRSDLGSLEQRLLDIYLADTAIILENVATALKMYEAIPSPRAQISDGQLNRDVIFDYNSRYFRLQNLLHQKLYRESLAALKMLEWEMPEERASPRMNLLKVQALIGNQQPQKAVVCLQRALLAEVDDTFTPRLRLELARLYLNMNHFAQARHQIDLIRKDSPWTREEIEARKLLLQLEEKIRGNL